jgi:hypothetical protein
MSLQQYVRQLNPRNESYTPHVDKIQSLLSEAKGPGKFSVWLDSNKDIDNWLSSFSRPPPYPKAHIKALMKFIKDKKLNIKGPIFAGAANLPKFKIRKMSPKNQNVIRKWIKEKKGNKFVEGDPSTATNIFKFGNGNPVEGTPDPSGADWESLITDKYNVIVKGTDKAASEAAEKFYPEYGPAAIKVATSFNKKLKMSTAMKQYGGGGGKKNLSPNWIKWGGTNGTPKTDMYTDNYNISLKKKGGSQLASGGKGETLATFNAALELMGSDSDSNKDIRDIMTKIENGFAKIKNKHLTAGLAGKIASGEKEGPDEWKDDIEKFQETEAFHKELNEELKDVLDPSTNPIFRKWYCFEAMSGYVKFGNTQSIASICIEFDAKSGAISKNIKVTSDGKSGDITSWTQMEKPPTVSSEIEALSKNVKIFAAWKTGDGSPASVLRALPSIKSDSVQPNSFRGIILNELRNDKVANKVVDNLNEELEQLDEFKIIKNVFDKVKSLTSKAGVWLTNIFNKIMIKVKGALDEIKKLGKKMFEKLFEFFNIVISSVRESFPKDLHGFVYGMAK